MVVSAMIAACTTFSLGCAAVRYGDYLVPAVRWDAPGNSRLPEADDARVANAIADWKAGNAESREQYPTAYHRYVDTPAPGTFEGEHIVGLAFSGGGTRGTVFGAMCVAELRRLGPVIADTPAGEVRIDLLDEIDYVSGVSTGAIPAAAFALNFGETCPDALRFEHWPGCFNRDVTQGALNRLMTRPDWVLRDFVVDMNARTTVSAAIGSMFFEGGRYQRAGGLTFGDLPSTPVLIMGAAVVNDPGTPFMQTRLPYRYAINEQFDTPWEVGIQSFESFRSDPMTYPLGEASYNSSSFLGHMRSGRLAVRDDVDWVYEALPGEDAERMKRSRNQPGYAGVYEIKDGGIVDNRGVYVIERVLRSIEAPQSRPLLILLDAGYLALRPPNRGGGILGKGWFDEFQAATRTSWQTGQGAHALLSGMYLDRFDYVRFRFSDWTAYLPDSRHGETAGAVYLVELCREYPRIGEVDRLLEVARSIGTTFSRLSEEQVDSLWIGARFSVWLNREALVDWARVAASPQ